MTHLTFTLACFVEIGFPTIAGNILNCFQKNASNSVVAGQHGCFPLTPINQCEKQRRFVHKICKVSSYVVSRGQTDCINSAQVVASTILMEILGRCSPLVRRLQLHITKGTTKPSAGNGPVLVGEGSR